MPYAIRKVRNKDCYSVKNTETGDVKARCTTFEKALSQERLLRAVDHGWKPTASPQKKKTSSRPTVVTAKKQSPQPVTSKKASPCWKGYERVPGTRLYEKGSCRKSSPQKLMPCSPGKNKKFAKVVNGECVKFGDPNMTIKKDNPARRKSFCARHKCSEAKDPATPRYQSCRKWNC